ncbi:DUF1360 domain-containing protein [Microbispora sp. ATCC PTA-5024]|uniref:DUF1360 domain-containing protein n=1 Tax=Microbispora sp. ATCC PTA-5024 TaxID=316330 RepID=UPI0003DD54BC|nr:DUF1360 domain-containing protein [Microbispora sp. ATCC PTA-5024]ETK31746.1 hypothetical protein MPTA5024_33585 [Microbispora sp. ATCC PTA-5024]
MTESLKEIQREYAGEERRPLASYARVLAVYGGAVSVLLAAGRLTGRRPPERISPMDLALMGLFTHRLSRTLAKDSVTSPIRAPFTRYAGVSGPAELREEVRGSGWKHALGELLTCPFCLAQWVATGYAAGMVFAPRVTRMAGTTMAAVAISDWLQLAYGRLMKAADG